ncbi:MAG: hypothetical protein ACLKAN_11190 [Alkaliphilus sp.]
MKKSSLVILFILSIMFAITVLATLENIELSNELAKNSDELRILLENQKNLESNYTSLTSL